MQWRQVPEVTGYRFMDELECQSTGLWMSRDAGVPGYGRAGMPEGSSQDAGVPGYGGAGMPEYRVLEELGCWKEVPRMLGYRVLEEPGCRRGVPGMPEYHVTEEMRCCGAEFPGCRGTGFWKSRDAVEVSSRDAGVPVLEEPGCCGAEFPVYRGSAGRRLPAAHGGTGLSGERSSRCCSTGARTAPVCARRTAAPPPAAPRRPPPPGREAESPPFPTRSGGTEGPPTFSPLTPPTHAGGNFNPRSPQPREAAGPDGSRYYRLRGTGDG